ncbi:MAG: GNAT family N-acetyltransferase [Alphaproteobacteria bacterium]|nr:GNAT family N-acetyltransferase [Alphaproteobacteria bacterium]
MQAIVRTLEPSDIPLLYRCAGSHISEPDYFEQCYEEIVQNRRVTFWLFIEKSGESGQAERICAGYVHYNRAPLYAPFRRLNIPEIQDLFIAPPYRRAGLAKTLIMQCEDLARREGHGEIGIGVGVGQEFGPAQRLYNSLGFHADGMGAVFERQAILSGALKPVDHRLCIMMLKSLI